MDLFPRLVLPDGDKELVLAACKHKRRTDIDVDFVADKGKHLSPLHPISQDVSGYGC